MCLTRISDGCNLSQEGISGISVTSSCFGDIANDTCVDAVCVFTVISLAYQELPRV